MRLFVAIDLSDETRARLLSFQDTLRAQAVSGHFTSPENLHLTLVTLIKCDEKQIVRAKQGIRGVGFEPFTLSIAGGGYLDKKRPNLVFCSLDNDAAYAKLRQLQSDLLVHLSSKGIELEQNKFRPHIMLGHEVVWRDIGDFSSFIDIHFPRMKEHVTDIVLMKSEHIHGRSIDVPVFRKTQTS